MYKDLNEILEKNATEEPGYILDEVERFLYHLGDIYRRGIITEEEFYIQTDTWTILEELLYKVNHLQFHGGYLRKSEDSFLESWEEYKAHRTIKEAEWMHTALRQTGSLREAAEWFLNVIDILKIPMGNLLAMNWKDYTGEYPNILYRNCGDEESISYLGKPKNIQELLECKKPIGKEFHLIISPEEIIDISIEKADEKHYEGTGMISGYMQHKGKIEITLDDDGCVEDIFFARRKVGRYDIRVAKHYQRIPHPKWNEYNMAFLSAAIKTEAEYKMLRLPYMLGIRLSDKGKKRKFHKNYSKKGFYVYSG